MSGRPDPLVDKYNEHARTIGALAITWGGAQESLFIVFCELADMPRPQADAIFFAIKADASQRDITLALAQEVIWPVASDIFDRLKKLIGEMGTLAGERNAAIHTMWRGDPENDRIIPSPITKRHHRKLRNDHLVQFQQLASRMTDIDDELFGIALEVRMLLASHRKHPSRPNPPQDNPLAENAPPNGR